MPPLQCASLDEIYSDLSKSEKNVKKTFKENNNCVKDNTEYQKELKKTIDSQNTSIENGNIGKTMPDKIMDHKIMKIGKTMTDKIMDYKEFFSPDDNIIHLLEQLLLLGKIIIVILILILIKK